MIEKSLLSTKEIFAKLDEEWNFEKLIKPYEEGGTKDLPVKRTWGTVIDYLVNKRKFPPEVVGAAIFLVWIKIKKDGHFKGDGSYGSMGREFVTTLRVMCAQVAREKLTTNMMTNLAGEIGNRIQVAFKNDFWTEMPIFCKVFSFNFYRFLWKKKRLKRIERKK